jgi:hypothetical protein
MTRTPTAKNISKITLQVYNDPGHGWVKTPLVLLQQLEIVKEITKYSYIKRPDMNSNKGFAYLEEDCDAATLINAMKAKGIIYTFKDNVTCSNKDSHIRSYPKFTVYTAWGL